MGVRFDGPSIEVTKGPEAEGNEPSVGWKAGLRRCAGRAAVALWAACLLPTAGHAEPARAPAASGPVSEIVQPAEVATRGRPKASAKKPRPRKLGVAKVKRDGRDYFTLQGRPAFQGRAGRTASSAHDLRHIIHYSTGIRRPYEAAANRYLAKHGRRAFVEKMQALFEEYDLLGGMRSEGAQVLKRKLKPTEEPSEDDVAKVMELSVTTLNSTPRNLFSESWTENQGSDQTRARAENAIEKIDDPGVDFTTAKQRALEAFADPAPKPPSGKARAHDGDSLAEVKREQLEIARQVVQSCPHKGCLVEALEDVAFSTTLDLPKAEGQEEVNRFALGHIARMRQISSGTYTGDDELGAVFRLNKMPALGAPGSTSTTTTSSPGGGVALPPPPPIGGAPAPKPPGATPGPAPPPPP